MGELTGPLYDDVLVLSEEGSLLMEQKVYLKAVEVYRAALAKLPRPENQWEAYVWLKASIGDALYLLKDFKKASIEFFDAMNGPDGASNGFVLLRLGECLFEQGLPGASDYLCKAYLLEGEDIFSREEIKYLSVVKALLKKHD